MDVRRPDAARLQRRLDSLNNADLTTVHGLWACRLPWVFGLQINVMCPIIMSCVLHDA